MILSLLAACATMGTLQSARPIDRGTVQVGLDAAAATTHGAGYTESSTQYTLAVRYGVSERTELGVRAGTNLPEVQLKRLLTVPDEDRVALSLAPTAGFYPTEGAGVPVTLAYGQVPLLVGVPLGKGTDLVVGPKLLWAFGWERDLPVWGSVVSAGLSAGASIRLARGVRIVPEVAGAWPIVYAGNELLGSGGAWGVQAGAAVLAGGERR